jgi:hypothetical protein
VTDPLRIAKPDRQPLRELLIDARYERPAAMKEVEERLGESVAAAKTKGRHAEVLWAYAYAYGRRQDSELTWEEAGEIKVSLVVPETAPVPPTGGDG